MRPLTPGADLRSTGQQAPFLKPTFSIAIRTLVEQILRQGDLRFDFLSSVRPVEGIRAHQRIQGERPGGYQAEVPVDLMVERDGFDLTVSGRIDGIQIDDEVHVVEEIKTTRRPLKLLEEDPNPIHWGQLKCYGYLWALKQRLTSVTLRLTYVHLPGYRTLELTKICAFDELASFFHAILDRYMAWVHLQADWTAMRDASIASMTFPFESYRPGQRAMAVAVYRTIRDGGQLMIQAATGIGKTMAAMFPAVKALQEQLAPKLVYLTARTTGRIAAENALTLLRAHGLKLRAVSLTAKDKICFCPESDCAPEECPYAAGYFDRVDDAVKQALSHEALTRDTVEDVARQHEVCPFELSLELVSWADCVIGDYNYAFAPGVMLQRLFGDAAQRHVVVVDEAHNLVDRSREMFSARLSKQTILLLRRRLKGKQPGIYQTLGRINAWLAAARRRCRDAGGQQVDARQPEALLERLRDFLWVAERWLTRNERSDFRRDLLSLFFECVRFVKVAEVYDQRFATVYEASGENLAVKLFCIDPAHLLGEAWQRSRCAVLFSATLAPAAYYRNILGMEDQAKGINIASPFPDTHLAVFAADTISTLYRRREDTCRQVSRVIAALVRQRTGNYMIFFPSYTYLDMVHRQFSREHPDVETLAQVPEMDDRQRAQYLERFSEHVSSTLVGFAVMGGIFGEGIDLKGDRLTAAVIVGVGLPGISPERELIRGYFESAGGCGFEFAYQYPGINRVLQAAGRVIRSHRDRGVVVLIDSRYGHHRYRTLLPQHWRIRNIGSTSAFQQALDDFWHKSRAVVQPAHSTRKPGNHP
jgi:DNA excision repair protein ERCC-2